MPLKDRDSFMQKLLKIREGVLLIEKINSKESI